MIIEKVKKIVKDKVDENVVGYKDDVWNLHVLPVVKYSKLLSKKLNSDEEIVEIAAYLHDYGSYYKKGWNKDHHIHSTRLAEEILKKMGYPDERIEKVKHCIFCHRASVKIPRESIEADIVASADAMAHIEKYKELLIFYSKYEELDIDVAKKKVLEKLEKGWKKMMPESREMMKEKYEKIISKLKSSE